MFFMVNDCIEFVKFRLHLRIRVLEILIFPHSQMNEYYISTLLLLLLFIHSRKCMQLYKNVYFL